MEESPIMCSIKPTSLNISETVAVHIWSGDSLWSSVWKGEM